MCYTVKISYVTECVIDEEDEEDEDENENKDNIKVEIIETTHCSHTLLPGSK